MGTFAGGEGRDARSHGNRSRVHFTAGRWPDNQVLCAGGQLRRALGSRLRCRAGDSGQGTGGRSGHFRRRRGRHAHGHHRARVWLQGVGLLPGRDEGFDGTGRDTRPACGAFGCLPWIPERSSVDPHRWVVCGPRVSLGLPVHRHHTGASAGDTSAALFSTSCEPESSEGHSTRSTSPISTPPSAHSINCISIGSSSSPPVIPGKSRVAG